METVHRTVGALEPGLRSALEIVVGHPLDANQRVTIQIREPDSTPPKNGTRQSACLPEWCDVLTDLTTEEETALATSLAARTESRDASSP